jgi:hypothetical protein
MHCFVCLVTLILDNFLLNVTYSAFPRDIDPNSATNFTDSDGKISSIGAIRQFVV